MAEENKRHKRRAKKTETMEIVPLRTEELGNEG